MMSFSIKWVSRKWSTWDHQVQSLFQYIALLVKWVVDWSYVFDLNGNGKRSLLSENVDPKISHLSIISSVTSLCHWPLRIQLTSAASSLVGNIIRLSRSSPWRRKVDGKLLRCLVKTLPILRSSMHLLQSLASEWQAVALYGKTWTIFIHL